MRACVRARTVVCDALVAACLKGDVEERPMMSVTLGDEHVGRRRQRLRLRKRQGGEEEEMSSIYDRPTLMKKALVDPLWLMLLVYASLICAL